MKCIACGQETKKSTCEHCGYSFTADSDFSCPNRNKEVCLITENVCLLENFNSCEIKQEMENEYF